VRQDVKLSGLEGSHDYPSPPRGNERKSDMSELDGASPREMEEFERRYVDTHTEIKAQSLLTGATSGQFRPKNNIRMEPGDKNAKRVGQLKKPIEKHCLEVQQNKMVGYLGDALDVRRKEILNKNDYPIDKLINALIKLMPQKVESEVNASMTFADMIKSVTLEQKRYKAIDAEDENDS
jgi:hypothetical protein